MGADQSVTVGVIGGAVLAAGLVGFYEWERAHQKRAATAATSAILTPATGTTGTPYTAEQAAADQRARDVAALRTQLADEWNNMDVLAVQLQTIYNRAPAPGLESIVREDLYRLCMAHTAANWFFGGARCDGEVTPAAIAAEVKKRTAQTAANEAQPFQAQLSAADARQRALISNLAALGVTVPPAQIRKGTA